MRSVFVDILKRIIVARRSFCSGQVPLYVDFLRGVGRRRRRGCQKSRRWLADERNTFPSAHSFGFRYGCRLYARHRIYAAPPYNSQESATEPLHVSSLSFPDRDVCRLGTHYGLPLSRSSATGRFKRAQERVRPSFLHSLRVYCPLTGSPKYTVSLGSSSHSPT